MKNQTISRYLLTILATWQLFSCSEDYLERTPLDEISEKDFWNTPEEMKLYVNQFYTMLPTFPGYGGGYLWDDNNSDNMLPDGYDFRLSGLSIVTTENSRWNFGDLRSINIMLANYQQVEGAESEIKQYAGEAYFFRAYFYFSRVKSYGDVPWIDHPLQPESEELYGERTLRNEVVDNILADLDTAIAYMSEKQFVGSNRLSKEAALLFKSRVALFEGTWEKYHNGTVFGVEDSNWEVYLQAAVDAAEQLMALNTVRIYNTGNPYSDYSSLFNSNDLSGISEAILWKKFDVSLDLSHNYQQYACLRGGSTGLTKSLVESYLCTDGNPISISPLYKGDHSLEQIVSDRDPRLEQIIWLKGEPTEINSGEVISVFSKPRLTGGGNERNTTGYQLQKGADPSSPGVQLAYQSETANVIFRYAEVLLNFAEAKAELGTITQQDIDRSVNLLRSRAGLPDLILGAIPIDPNREFQQLTPLLNEIRRERRVELACEGYRLDDLLRWRAINAFIGERPKGAWFDNSLYPELIPGETILVDSQGYIDPYQQSLPEGWQFNPDRDYLLPIPPDQLTLNPDLKQNPGW